MKSPILVLFTSAMLVACQAHESDLQTNQFVGSWRLVSSEGRGSDGSVTYEWGTEPIGRAMFDDAGRLSLHLIQPNRRNFQSGDFLRPTRDELSEAFSGYFGYFGSYTVDEDEGVVTFHIDGAAYPNYIGTNQVRNYEIVGNRLILTTPPERAGGIDVVYVVTWERE